MTGKQTSAIAFLALAAASGPGPALAQSVDDVGSAIYNASQSIEPFALLLVAVCYLLGVGLFASGLMRLKDTNERGGNFADAIFRMVGASFLVALPDTLGVGVMSFYNLASYNNVAVMSGLVQQPEQCMTAASPLTCVAKNIGVNVVPVFAEVSFVLFFMVGAFMVASAIYAAATSHASGQQQMPRGWAAKLLIGFIVLNVPVLMKLIGETLGVSNGVIGVGGMASINSGHSLLSYAAPSGVAVLAQYAELVKWVFVILVMFGIIAVWRGIMLIKAFADGTGQGTMGAGMTHIVGGVMLANGKFCVCLVVNTMLGTGLGFC